MGKGETSSTETQAHHLSSGQKEDPAAQRAKWAKLKAEKK
jgi:hypothetical protein